MDIWKSYKFEERTNYSKKIEKVLNDIGKQLQTKTKNILTYQIDYMVGEKGEDCHIFYIKCPISTYKKKIFIITVLGGKISFWNIFGDHTYDNPPDEFSDVKEIIGRVETQIGSEPTKSIIESLYKQTLLVHNSNKDNL